MRRLACLLLALTWTGPIAAQTPEEAAVPAKEKQDPTQEAVPARVAEAPPPQRFFDLANNDRLTGDWGGLRTSLEDKGIEFGLGLTTIYQHNAHGGVNTKNGHRVSGSYDLELTLDLGAMSLVDGGILYLLAEGSWDDGVGGRGYIGDILGVNEDAGGDRAIDVTELWYEQSFLDDKLRVRFGKMDLGVDFETNAYANDEVAQFLNSALVNASNVPFPDNGIGIQLIATPCEWFYFGAGVADAQADARETGFRTAFHDEDDVFAVFEFGFTPTLETAWGTLPGNYRFGLWYDPQPKEKFFNDLGGRLTTIPMKRDDVGFYTNLDQVICKENPDINGDDQGLGVFFRYAYAHADVNEIEDFWSIGAQYVGLIPTRDDDVLGFGVAQGMISEQVRDVGERPRRETVLELYYNMPITPWLSVTPDFQWILDPGGRGDGRDAFVAGLRLQATF